MVGSLLMDNSFSREATDWREGRRLRAFELKEEGWSQQRKRSHRLARRKAFESLRTQGRRMVSATNSRSPGREQGGGKPVDEAGPRRRGSGGSEAPTRPWGTAAPE